ncbi:MAG: hypothetical protein RBT65_18395 [Methanolobus sp.]|nr:hypothetical protein [Methanolobus sp.]
MKEFSIQNVHEGRKVIMVYRWDETMGNIVHGTVYNIDDMMIAKIDFMTQRMVPPPPNTAAAIGAVIGKVYGQTFQPIKGLEDAATTKPGINPVVRYLCPNFTYEELYEKPKAAPIKPGFKLTEGGNA